MSRQHQRNKRKAAVPRRLALLIALALAGVLPAQARDYFNPALLELDGPQRDVSSLAAFEEHGKQLPGDYQVDILVNDRQVDSRMLTFTAGADGQGLQPCLSLADLAHYGVRVAQFPALGAPGAACTNLAAIPQAGAQLRFDSQQLMLSIPQAALAQPPRGYVPPSQWDEGIPALILNYSLSGDNNNTHHGSRNSQYANLRPGLNAGPWRLRNYTTWRRSSDGQDRWDTVYTYAQRNLIGLRSQLTLGDSTAPAEVFDGVPFRGVQLASDDEMLPDSLRGYAPVVRGIARTNAQVVVSQNGY